MELGSLKMDDHMEPHLMVTIFLIDLTLNRITRKYGNTSVYATYKESSRTPSVAELGVLTLINHADYLILSKQIRR